MDGQHARPWLGCFATIIEGQQLLLSAGRDDACGSCPAVLLDEGDTVAIPNEVGIEPVPRNMGARRYEFFVNELADTSRKRGF